MAQIRARLATPCRVHSVSGSAGRWARRRELFVLFATLLALGACGREPADFSELTIVELHDRMQRGETSSEQLVGWYLNRIEAVDRGGPALRAMIEINPDALLIARALDEEWRSSGPRGPLHGIPIVVKANIDTADRMHTTAGSLALADHRPQTDAFLVSRLRDAGAVILGKTNLSEWANFRSVHSSSGWSSVGGQTRNPYGTGRNPCGSSSGSAVAVAANLAVVAVGTETDGSIVCPAGVNGIVGIKPTLGLVSRSGIIPIAHSQDTAGPMARTVRDAAILLGAMTGVDSDDAATFRRGGLGEDYTSMLTAAGLEAKRIGVLRSYSGAGEKPRVESVFEWSLESLRSAGAEVIDPIRLETGAMLDAEYEVLLFEFKNDIELYLERSAAPLRTLDDIIAFNEANAESVMPYFGQDVLLAANAKGPLTDGAYVEALATSKRIAQTELDETFREQDLDALVAPTNGPAWLTDHVHGDRFDVGSSSFAAVSGYPSITVPAGHVAGLPIGLSFIGRPGSEKLLIEIAYAFEQLTAARRAPEL